MPIAKPILFAALLALSIQATAQTEPATATTAATISNALTAEIVQISVKVDLPRFHGLFRGS